MKTLLLSVLVLFMMSCNLVVAQTNWEDIEIRLVEINERYKHSQITIDAIPQSEKEKLMRLSPEELERFLVKIDRQQAADHARIKALSEGQKAKFEAFEQIVLPLIEQSESTEEFHRIVLKYQQYCNEEMVEQSKAWLAENAPELLN